MADLTHTHDEDLLAAGTLDDDELELLMLLADGELDRDPARRTLAEQLAASKPEAREILHDLRSMKATVHELVVGETAAAAVTADLSMLRGRVMTRLPDTPRAEPQPAKSQGLWGWFQALGFGKGTVVTGFALAAVALLVATRAPVAPPAVTEGPAMASHDPQPASATSDEPSVIIEEMDIEESVTVTPGSQPSAPTVIWHFQPSGEGEG